MARRGISCIGVELDDAVAGYANRRLAKAEPRGRVATLVGDIRRLDRLVFPAGIGPPFDFAFIPHNSIRHLPTPEDVVRHLRAVRAVLRPSGAYAVGVGLQPQDVEIFGEDIHSASRGSGRSRLRVTSVFQYFESPASGPLRLERIVSITTIRRGDRRPAVEVQSTSSYDLLCITPEMWRTCVQKSGLVEVAVVDDSQARPLPRERTDYAYRILRPAD